MGGFPGHVPRITGSCSPVPLSRFPRSPGSIPRCIRFHKRKRKKIGVLTINGLEFGEKNMFFRATVYQVSYEKEKKMWVGTNNGLEFDKKDGFERNNVLDFTGEKKKMGVKMNHGFEFGKKKMGVSD